MAKPVSPRCDLRCRYCYYPGRDRLYPDTKRFQMDDNLLEAFMRDSINAHGGPEVPFACVIAMWRLRRHSDAVRLANGRR